MKYLLLLLLLTSGCKFNCSVEIIPESPKPVFLIPMDEPGPLPKMNNSIPWSKR